MRKTLIFLACLLPLAASAYTSIQFQLSNGNLNISPFTNVQITLQQVGINQNATMQFLGEPIYQFTDTNAQTTFSNLQTAAGGATSYWAWTVPANSTPNGPIQSYSGYVQVTSTNLGTISASLVGVFAVPTPTGLGWAYSAQTSDLRYAQGTNTVGGGFSLGSYVTGSNTNPLVGFLGVDTNFDATETTTVTAYLAGPVPAFITNGLATTNYANGVTNNFTSIVFSNPAAFTLFPQVTNIAQAQANAVGLNDTNYATGATNIAVANLTAGLAGTNTALAAALNATNLLLLADINTASNAVKSVGQPASGILTNLAGTSALTNGLAAGQNFSLTTNGTGTFIFLNATNQTFLTNGLAVWSSVVPTSYATTNALASATNGLVSASVTNGLATLQAATNAANGVYSNNPAGYAAAGITNGLATTNYVQTYADTNGAAAAAVKALVYQGGSGILTNLAGTGALTNGLVAGLNLTLVTNGAGTLITINSTNQTFLTNGLLTGYAPTNTLNGWYDTNGAAAYAAKVATNGMLPIITNIASQYASSNVNTNQYVAGQNVSLTTNVSGSITYINATNQTFLTNGLLTGYANTNTLNGWYETNNAALWAYTNSVAYSTNYAATNTAAAVATALNFASTNTALPFVSTNIGNVGSLTIATTLAFGADTNFILGTNWITVKGAGSGQANGVYNQIAPGVYTNNSFPGISIVNSGGIFNLLNTNGQTLYVTNTVNGFWLIGPYGSAPKPYVAYSPTFDPILLGNIYATNLAAQWQAYVSNFVLTNSGGSSFTNVLGGVITNTALNTVFSIAGTNVILTLIAQYASSPTNGITLLQATNVVTSMTNGLATTNYVMANSGILSSNGFGTNTTFAGTISMVNPAIPYMTGYTTPSGTASASSEFSATYLAWKGFEDVSHRWSSAYNTAAYVQYQFPTAQTVIGFSIGYIYDNANNLIVQYSGDGSNWTNLYSGIDTNSYYFAPVTGSYFRWNFLAGGSGRSSSAGNIQLQGFPQVLNATNGLQIQTSAAGVCINTNYAAGNALEVNGNIDSTVGYSINGTPIGGGYGGYYVSQQNGVGTNITLFGTNFLSGTYLFGASATTVNALYASGSAYTAVNGTYISATNNGVYYTNTVSGVNLINFWALGEPHSSPQFTIATNFTINPFTTSGAFQFNNYSLVGTYGATYGTTGTVLVAYSSSLYTNLTGVGVSINTNSVGTNTLEVNGQIDTVAGYSVRGFAGATASIPIQTNAVGPHGITLLYTNGLFYGTQNY